MLECLSSALGVDVQGFGIRIDLRAIAHFPRAEIAARVCLSMGKKKDQKYASIEWFDSQIRRLIKLETESGERWLAPSERRALEGHVPER